MTKISLRYGLLPQEARIVGQLATGSSRASLPDDLGVSRDTVKWQIKRLLARVEVGDTTDLVALLLRTIGESQANAKRD